MQYNTCGNPGIGLSIRNVEGIFYNRTGSAVTVGMVLMVDHLAANGASYAKAAFDSNDTVAYAQAALNVDGGTGDANAATDPMANLIVPTAAGLGILSGGSTGVGTGSAGAFLVVVTSLLDGAGADNTKVKACISGIVPVACITTEPVVYGDTLYAAVATTLTPLVTAAVRPVGKAVGAKSDNDTQLVLCLFNGDDVFQPQFAS